MNRNNNQVSVNFGGGFTGLLTILFIALKLTGYISWSWWWVLSPVWIPFCIMMVILLIAAVLYTVSRL